MQGGRGTGTPNLKLITYDDSYDSGERPEAVLQTA